MTELIEPSFPASEAEARAMLEAFDKTLEHSSGAAFCGSLPDGTDPILYVRAAELAKKHNALLLIDAFRNLENVFAAGAQIVLKINKEELEKLSGVRGVAEGLKTLFSRFPNLKYAAITDGPGTAFASDRKVLAAFTLPELPFVASPLGCGDTASAVLLAELCSGKELFTAFQAALAAASANCLNPTPGKFLPEDGAKLLPSYSVEELNF